MSQLALFDESASKIQLFKLVDTLHEIVGLFALEHIEEQEFREAVKGKEYWVSSGEDWVMDHSYMHAIQFTSDRIRFSLNTFIWEDDQVFMITRESNEFSQPITIANWSEPDYELVKYTGTDGRLR